MATIADRHPGLRTCQPGPLPYPPAGKDGQPPAGWMYTDPSGAAYDCEPVDGFDPSSPRYTCTATSAPSHSASHGPPTALSLGALVSTAAYRRWLGWAGGAV